MRTGAVGLLPLALPVQTLTTPGDGDVPARVQGALFGSRIPTSTGAGRRTLHAPRVSARHRHRRDGGRDGCPGRRRGRVRRTRPGGRVRGVRLRYVQGAVDVGARSMARLAVSGARHLRRGRQSRLRGWEPVGLVGRERRRRRLEPAAALRRLAGTVRRPERAPEDRPCPGARPGSCCS